MATQSRKKQIGKSLQKRRKDAGYSSAEKYAVHMNEKPDTYTGYEQGRIALPLDKAWEFADDLECTLDELVGRDFPPSRVRRSKARKTKRVLRIVERGKQDASS